MVFGVWCPLPIVGDVCVLLWGFGSKNLIGPVRSGKPLGLFNVTWPYAWVWHLKHLMGRQVPLNLSLAWVVACTSALDSHMRSSGRILTVLAEESASQCPEWF